MARRAELLEAVDYPQIVVGQVARRATRSRWQRRVLPKLASGSVDLVAIALAAWIAYGLSGVSADPEAPTAGGYAAFSLVMAPVWLAVLARYGLYASRRITSRTQEYRQVFHAVVVCVTATSLVDYAFDVNLAHRWVILTWVLALGLVASDREVSRRLFKRLRMRGRMMRPILIVGANAEGQGIADMLDERPWLGYQVLGFTDDVEVGDESRIVFGPTSKTLDIALDQRAMGVVVATSAIDADTCNTLARELVEAGVYVELSSTLRDVASQRLLLRPLGRYPVVCLQPVRRTGWRGVAKRTADIAIAALLLIFTAPVLALAALAIKLDSPGPVFFRQQRIGKDGKLFTIFKFRTMCADAENRLAEVASLNEAHGPLFKIRDDPRTTRVGKVLRRFSIDEIPQLWNVLRDEMSMVGPRPALPSEADRWALRTRDRLLVKPGLTGMWQVNGRSNASFEQYEQLDLYYVDNWSLIIDLMIIMRTVPVLLARDGAY